MRERRTNGDGSGPLAEQCLLQRLLRGEGAAWNAFHCRYEGLVVGCVLRVLRRFGAVFSHEDLADLVGEVWLALVRDDCRKLRLYDPERGYRLSSWIGLIATNCTIDQLRMRRADPSSLEEIAGAERLLVAPGRPDRRLEQAQAAALARRALSRLSSEEQHFVICCFHEERPPAELAAEMGVTINTIYSRKFKVRAKLTRILATLEQPPPVTTAELAA